MQAHTRTHHHWRHFRHKYGLPIFLGIMVAAIVALVILLMYVLTRPEYRVRW